MNCFICWGWALNVSTGSGSTLKRRDQTNTRSTLWSLWLFHIIYTNTCESTVTCAAIRAPSLPKRRSYDAVATERAMMSSTNTNAVPLRNCSLVYSFPWKHLRYRERCDYWGQDDNCMFRKTNLVCAALTFLRRLDKKTKTIIKPLQTIK